MLGPEDFADGLGIGLKSFFGGTVGRPHPFNGTYHRRFQNSLG